VLDALKAAQGKHGDADGLRHTESLLEKLYAEHDELKRDDAGNLSDASDDDDDDADGAGGDEDGGDEDINLDEISDDSGCCTVSVLGRICCQPLQCA